MTQVHRNRRGRKSGPQASVTGPRGQSPHTPVLAVFVSLGNSFFEISQTVSKLLMDSVESHS